jgi:hypothetical protein
LGYSRASLRDEDKGEDEDEKEEEEEWRSRRKLAQLNL